MASFSSSTRELHRRGREKRILTKLVYNKAKIKGIPFGMHLKRQEKWP